MDEQSRVDEQEPVAEEVAEALEEEKEQARRFSLEDIRNGNWFISLLKRVLRTFDHNARASYFQQKYPGLSRDALADKLISVTSQHAAIAGGITGATTTVDQIATLTSLGLTTSLFVGSIGGEMLYTTAIQLRLVLDLSVVYGIEFDPEDPEDIMVIFGYALGVAPVEFIGATLTTAAATTAKTLVKTYISGETLRAVKKFGSKYLGVKILQRSIIKYAMPVASTATGSMYNYITTQSLGYIASAHFRNLGAASEELKKLVSRQKTYDMVFPAAMMYIAQVDEKMNEQELQLYMSTLKRMSLEGHTNEEFKCLVDTEESIIAAIQKLVVPEQKQCLLDLLILMAIYDGKLVDAEEAFLTKVAETLDIAMDMEQVQQRVREYEAVVKETIGNQTSSAIKAAAAKVREKMKRTNQQQEQVEGATAEGAA